MSSGRMPRIDLAIAPGGEGARARRLGSDSARLPLTTRSQPSRSASMRASKRFIGGLARKPATKVVGRVAVDLHRRADLHDAAVVHDADPLAHGHGLDLVVGDVDDGAAEPPVQLDQLGAHAAAQLGVEVGERLVEQVGDRVADQRAAERHPLALAAGELGAACGPAARRCRACPRYRAPWPRSRRGRGRGSACRSRGCPRRSCAGTARSSGTRWRGCGPSGRRR